MGCRIWMTTSFKACPHTLPRACRQVSHTHVRAKQLSSPERFGTTAAEGIRGRGSRSRGNLEALDASRGSSLSRRAFWPKGAPPTHGAAVQRRGPPRVDHEVEKSGHRAEASTEPPSDRHEVVVLSVQPQEGGHLRAVLWVEARAHHDVPWSRHLPPAKPRHLPREPT